MKTALITGASGGIGYELARVFAQHKHNLVLVARSAAKLELLAQQQQQEFGIKAFVVAADLSLPQAAAAVFEQLQKENIRIDFLVNNAGFGNYGLFMETDWPKEEQMINLNITALTHFTKVFGQKMVRNRSGRILNVASTAAFQPGPLMAVYFATKAYVLSFSEAIANELQGTGVTVTALCPGPTESGFVEAAALHNSKLFKGKKIAASREVAEYGYQVLMRGRIVAVQGTTNRVMANLVKFFPRKWVTAMARKISERVS